MKFKEDMNISITEYLRTSRDHTIKKILDLLDMSDISQGPKKRVRKAVLEEVNSFYATTCRVLTCIQEKENGT